MSGKREMISGDGAVPASGVQAGLEEQELLARVGAGDGEAFDLLYQRFVVLVYSTALHTLADVQAAEDVTQEIFLRLWRRPDHFDPERGRFVTWLLSVTRNRAVDELRSRGRRRRLATDPPEAAETSADPDMRDDPESALVVSDDRATVRRALSGLPAEQRTALEMAYFGGMTQTEIAAALGQPLGTVKTRIRLGMQKMRVAILAEGRTLAR